MHCQTCGGKSQPETVLKLAPSLSGVRMVRQNGWYCWTCKVSHSVVAAPAAGRPRKPDGWLNALRTAMAGPQLPDRAQHRTPPAAPRYWQPGGHYAAH